MIGSALPDDGAGAVAQLPGGLLGFLVGIDFQAHAVGGLHGVVELQEALARRGGCGVDVGEPHLHLVASHAGELEVGEPAERHGVALQIVEAARPGILLHSAVHLHVQRGAGQAVRTVVAQDDLPVVLRLANQVGRIADAQQRQLVLLLGHRPAVGRRQHLVGLHVLQEGHHAELLHVVDGVNVPFALPVVDGAGAERLARHVARGRGEHAAHGVVQLGLAVGIGRRRDDVLLDGSHEEAQAGVLHVAQRSKPRLHGQMVALQLLLHVQRVAGGLAHLVVDGSVHVGERAVENLHAVDERRGHPRHVVEVHLLLVGLLLVEVEGVGPVGIVRVVLNGDAVAQPVVDG